MVHLIDSFDHYAIGDITQKWTQLYAPAGGTMPSISTGTGRRGSNSVRFTQPVSGGTARPLAIVIPQTNNVVVGFAFRPSGTGGFEVNAGPTAGLYPWYGFASPFAGQRGSVLCWFRCDDYTQVGVRINYNGTLEAIRGDAVAGGGLVVLGSTLQALQWDQWYYIDLRVLVHGSAGEVEIRVDCDVWLTLTGVNTHYNPSPYSTPAQIDEIVIGGNTAGNNVSIGNSGQSIWDYDDLYILDDVTTDPLNDEATFLGDIRVDWRLPTADGAFSDFVPLSGPDNYAMVDETPPDGDTTYNSTSTPAAQDTFVVQAAPVGGVGVRIMQVAFSRKRAQDGPGSSRALVRAGGVNYPGTTRGDQTTYTYNRHIWTRDPSDSGAITEADFNAFEVGYEKVI